MDSYTPLSSRPDLEAQDSTEPELPREVDIDQPPTPAELQARTDYMKHIAPQHKPKKRKWLRIIAVVMAVLLLLGAGGYAYQRHHKTAKTSTTQKSAAAVRVAPAPQTSSTMLHYVSNGNDLNLDFDYPSTWSVTPITNNNSGDGTITATSPLVSIANAAGSNVTGRVIFTIRPGSAGISELSKGQAATGQASVQIAYSKPTSAQHQYPYLTFIHLEGGTNTTSMFDEVLVSGVTQFSAGTSLTDSSVSTDPIISASFYNCTTSACSGTGATALNITNSTWLSNPIFQQTLAIIQSLQLN